MGLSGYRYLKSYQLTVVIYDLTIEFVKHWINPHSRTKDQMEQAARSGKQNIIEGYMEKSLKSYIYLAGVAYASLGELLEDFADFARQNKIPVWDKARAKLLREVREVWEKSTPENPYIPDLPSDKEIAVNLMITLINQAIFLLKRQIDALEEKFIKEGGFTENLFKKRIAEKRKGGNGC